MRNVLKFAALTAMACCMSTHALAQEALTAPGPQGDLSGTLIRPAEGQPLVLIVPGSGPTDRDGNNPLGVTAASYRLLSEALGQRGIGTLRIDKRGMFGSAGAIADANDVTIDAYTDDVSSWVGSAREATGRECIWLLGHSEGGLVALAAAQSVNDLCGVILLAALGRSMGDTIRAQIKANPANAPILPDALSAIDALEAGDQIDVSGMHPALQGLFAPQVQGFLIDAMAYDPTALVKELQLPVLIVQGGRDIQIMEEDGASLHAARPETEYVVLSRMNHVLKNVASEDRAANMATYSDASLPVAPELVDAIADFVTKRESD